MGGIPRSVSPARRFPAWQTMVLVLAVVTVAAPAFAPAPAAAGTTVAEEVAKALGLCWNGEFDQSLALASSLLERDDLEADDRVAVYSALSSIHYSMGKQHAGQAFAYLEKIRELDPCLASLPSDFWTKPLREQWYRALQANGQLVCATTASPEIRTVAVMEFDNYSAGKYQEELGFLTKGLSDFFEADFRELGGLKVVERDKIDFVLKEIMMAKEGLVDESTAVKAGKLLGAQIMIFGSVMQTDGKNARMLVKAVKVETSEILATAERKGKPDFFAMQEELVKDLAGKLDIAISPAAEQQIEANGSDNGDAAGQYAKGLYHVDRYEYAKAYDCFKRAYELDNTYAEAKHKMDIYRPLALSS